MEEKKTNNVLWLAVLMFLFALFLITVGVIGHNGLRKSDRQDLIDLNHKVNIADSLLLMEIEKNKVNVKDSLHSIINDYLGHLNKQQEIKCYEWDSLIRIDTSWVFHRGERVFLDINPINTSIKISKEDYKLLTIGEVEEKKVHPVMGRVTEPSIEGLGEYISPYKMYFDSYGIIRRGAIDWAPITIDPSEIIKL